jgi:GNAT superfamily N-acetyltransferase
VTVPIRPLAARDRPRWERLFRGYIDFYRATIPDDVIEATWQRLLARESDFHLCLVAVNDADEAIGLAHILFHRSTWTTGYYCYLEDLFVEPDLRARGVGRALIEAVYGEADARGAVHTYWLTQEFNYRARGLYDQVATRSPFIQYRR